MGPGLFRHTEMVGHMSTTRQVQNAQRRVDRFVTEHGDELLRLSKARQAEVLEDAYQGRGKMARVKLRMYSQKIHAIRSEASAKAAQTVLLKRQLKMGDRIDRLFPNANRFRVMKNVKNFTSSQLRDLEKMTDNTFETFVKSEASAASRAGAVMSPFFYR